MKNPELFFKRNFSMRLLTSCVWCSLAILLFSTSASAQLTADDWQPGQLIQRQKQTDPHEEVQKALRQAKYALAMRMIDQYMSQNPLDPQMRFWKGFVLEKQNKPDEALEVYKDLTQEYPELPEPHNNLGVIYASRADYENAQAAFEAALRSNPNYSVAQENLADMLLHRAQSLYQSALTNSKQQQRSAAKKLELLSPALSLSESPR
jgi:tetratricopeptide (TPR) repeat protein